MEELLPCARALVPTIPYLLTREVSTGLPTSLVSMALALATGIIIGISAGLNPIRKALKMIFSGLRAAGITFGVGRLASSLIGAEIGKILKPLYDLHT
ncbi:MAG TPA: hypothetical protein ENF57_01715 [Candidatus Korarchaeota archaeon]|nr:hypothetical protein [Candidatus Korarchaeota archaeon]